MKLTSVLRVALLQITQSADELLARDVLVVGEEVVLSRLARVVDEDVCIRRHSRDRTDHVAARVGLRVSYEKL